MLTTIAAVKYSAKSLELSAPGPNGVADVYRKHNCSEQSFYRWNAKSGGIDVSEAKRLNELEQANSEFKMIVADQALDIRMLKDVNRRKW